MKVLELAQQMYNDQKRLQAKRIDGYAICPIYHYEDLRFTVNCPQDYDLKNPKYMGFNADCELIEHFGFTGLLLKSLITDEQHQEFAAALEQYLAQDVE